MQVDWVPAVCVVEDEEATGMTRMENGIQFVEENFHHQQNQELPFYTFLEKKSRMAIRDYPTI